MNKKILILTMSCNTPYFQALLGAVRDTWAKPLMRNMYDNITWFAYTACDEKHPRPYVDFEDHMIYVDCSDDLKHTYMKTQLAYQAVVKCGIEFDYVLRTNTSIFMNIDKMLERIGLIEDTDIMARANRFDLPNQEGKPVFKSYTFIGFCMGMNREMFEIAMSANNDYLLDETGSVYPTHDDVIMSLKILDTLDMIHNVGFTEDDVCPAYKVYEIGDEPPAKRQLNPKDFFHSPEFIKDYPIARLRSLYEGELRDVKGHEIEHMYELYNELMKR